MPRPLQDNPFLEEEGPGPSFRIEASLSRLGYHSIAGVDEAGRGPLAGPVVAAAVILPPLFSLPGVRDSKTIPEEERERLHDAILDITSAVGIGCVEAPQIDATNILRATLEAMHQAVENLNRRPDFLLIDGNQKIFHALPQRAIIRGESISLSIAAASIVAKVHRDRIMRRLDQEYPQYLFRKNKGYGTPEHRSALRRFGPSPVHRKSFKGVSP